MLALLGDNGAGKSTLIKILSGVVDARRRRDPLGGEAVRISSPKHARELGIETVFQDLALFDNTPAVGNFFAGRERTRARSGSGSFGWVDDRGMRKETDELIERLQVKLPGQRRRDRADVRRPAPGGGVRAGDRVRQADRDPRRADLGARRARVGQRAAADQRGAPSRACR